MKPNREELERVHYNGLTTADKGALLDAKARGAEWVARDTNNDLYGYAVEPIDDIDYGWTTPFIGNVITINAESMKFVALHEKINIDLALAQIAEIESELTANSTPMTWNERINQMTVEEKGEFFAMFNCPISLQSEYDCSKHANCIECMTAFFASPYTEGATK